MGAKKADDTALTVTTQLKRRLIKDLQYRYILTFSSIQCIHMEDSIVRLKLNSVEKVILCAGDTNSAYTLSDISLEYDVIFDEPYDIVRHCLKKTLPGRLM